MRREEEHSGKKRQNGFVGKEGDAKVELNCLRNASKSKCGGKIDALNKFHFTNMNLLVQDNISVKNILSVESQETAFFAFAF